MTAFIIKRVLLALPMLLAVAFFSFVLIGFTGENYFDQYRTDRHWDPAVIREMEREAHLDEPVPLQFLHWLRGVLFDVRIFRRETIFLDGESADPWDRHGMEGNAKVAPDATWAYSGRRSLRIEFPPGGRLTLRRFPDLPPDAFDPERFGWLRLMLRNGGDRPRRSEIVFRWGTGGLERSTELRPDRWEVVEVPVADLAGTGARRPDISIEIRSDGGALHLDHGTVVESRLRFSAGMPNFQDSFRYHAPVFRVLAPRLGNTLLLSLSTMLLAWLVAVPLGIHCAVRRNRRSDRFFSTFTFVGMSIPNFFLALVVLYLAVRANNHLGAPILPTGGNLSTRYDELGLLGRMFDRAHHLILPVCVSAVAAMAALQRIARGNLLDVLRRDYIRTARAKGLPENRVIYKHAVRNALNPLVTIFGYHLSALIGGSALIEIIFAYPGMGYLLYEATVAKDVYVVLASVTTGGAILIAGNLLADLALARLDPRIGLPLGGGGR